MSNTDSDDEYVDPYAGETKLPDADDMSALIEAAFGDSGQDGAGLLLDALDERIAAAGLKHQGSHGDAASGRIFTAPYLHQVLTARYGPAWWSKLAYKRDLIELKTAIDSGRSDYESLSLLKAVQGQLSPAQVSAPGKGQPGDPRRARARALYQILTAGVKYVQANARHRYRSQPQHGALYRQRTRQDRNVAPFSTDALIAKAQAAGKWVSDLDGEGKCLWIMLQEPNNKVGFYSHVMKRGRFHHSSLNAGNGVAAAGEWKTNSDGRITAIYGSSGHYQPEPWRLIWALRELRTMGVLGNAKLYCRTTDGSSPLLGMVEAQKVLGSLTSGKLNAFSFY